MKNILKFLKPFALSVTGVVLLVFFQSLAELFLPTLMANLVDYGIAYGNTGYIIKVGGFMLLVALAGACCAITAGFLATRTAMGFGRNLRNAVFSRVEEFSLNEINKFGASTLITRTTNDVNQVQMITMMALRMMVSAPLMAIGGIIMATSKNPRLSWIFLLVLPAMSAIIVYINRRGLPLFKAIQQKIDRISLILRENLVGIRIIRAFNRVDYEQKRFSEANRELTDTSIKVFKIMALMMPLTMLLMNLTIVAIIWFGGILINQGGMLVGNMIAFIQYATQIMFSLVMLSMMFVMIPRASVSAARINEVLETVPEIYEPSETKHLDDCQGMIEFKNVTFNYPRAEQPALSGISFTAIPGKVTAIIGGTGSGKSTLVNLIPRFYDVVEGSILIDGIDVRQLSLKELKTVIGYVPQKSVLFSGTIKDNINYGSQEAQDSEIREAARISQVEDFILSLEDGYDTIIAQGGNNLSGGQKQRLAIARTLVRRPKIFIFDDSFSALDFETEARLRQALKKKTVGTTVLIVAQRIGTVLDADQIIVLDMGKIVGIGKHQELLDTCNIYREIVSSQLAKGETV